MVERWVLPMDRIGRGTLSFTLLGPIFRLEAFSEIHWHRCNINEALGVFGLMKA